MKGCKTAASRSDEGVGNALRTQDDRSKKIRIPWLGAGPRAAGHQTRTAGQALTAGWSELPLLAGLKRGWTDIVRFAPGVFLDRWWSADTARRLVFAASVGLLPGTRGCSIEPGDMWDETVSRSL
jgi:hypothetical protein